MPAAARKTGSKSTSKRASKRAEIPAEVVNLVDRRFAKIRTELRGAMDAMEKELARRLADLGAIDPIVRAGLEADADDRATPAQILARKRALRESLKHNDPASDEQVEAIVREWD